MDQERRLTLAGKEFSWIMGGLRVALCQIFTTAGETRLRTGIRRIEGESFFLRVIINIVYVLMPGLNS